MRYSTFGPIFPYATNSWSWVPLRSATYSLVSSSHYLLSSGPGVQVSVAISLTVFNITQPFTHLYHLPKTGNNWIWATWSYPSCILYHWGTEGLQKWSQLGQSGLDLAGSTSHSGKFFLFWYILFSSSL